MNFSVIVAVLIGVANSQEFQKDGRVKRGASVYISFPASHAFQPQVPKSPQDFINTIGGNNQYYADAGYGGSLASQYALQGSFSSPSGSGAGHGGSGYGGRRRRSTASIPQFPNAYELDLSPYIENHNFDLPSWSSEPSDEYQAATFSLPQADLDDTTPFPLHLPNPVVVNGLLEAATVSNAAQSKVFRAYTARTPYFGLNGSFDAPLPNFVNANVNFNNSNESGNGTELS